MRQPIRKPTLSDVAEKNKTNGVETYLMLETPFSIIVGKLFKIDAGSRTIVLSEQYDIVNCKPMPEQCGHYNGNDGRFYTIDKNVYQVLIDTCSKIQKLVGIKDATVKALKKHKVDIR